MATELPVWFNLESVRVYKQAGGTVYELDVPNTDPTVGIKSPPYVGSMQSATNIPRVVFTTPTIATEQTTEGPQGIQAASVNQSGVAGSGFDWKAGLLLAGLAWLLFKRK